MQLVYKHEKPLFRIAAFLSGLFWLVLIVGTFGIALLYILLMYLFFLFAHSAFISYLKGTGVRISENQYPDLNEKLLRCCQEVGLDKIPEAYLLRTDFFNALATRFLGRNYIVLFTDVVDALESQPNAIDFYIGHELGHIHRKHLLWSPFLMPASILPILGAALRRAEEYTCDRYGVACCQNQADIKAAIAAIAAGNTKWKSINIDAYLEQVQLTTGFWMSFNEITGDYPWLTKRMATCLALTEGKELKHPRRSALAWFLSLFIPRIGAGGGIGSLLYVVIIVGILAAVAIPAYQNYIKRAHYSAAYSSAQIVQNHVAEYFVKHQTWPITLTDLGFAKTSLVDDRNTYEINLYEDGIIGTKVGTTSSGEDMYIVIEPSVEEGNLNWICYGQNLPEQHLPPNCR